MLQAYAAMEASEEHPWRAALVLERAESEGCCLHERIWITHSDLLLAGMRAKGPVIPSRFVAACHEKGWGGRTGSEGFVREMFSYVFS